MNLIQLEGPEGRRIGIARFGGIHLLENHTSIYSLAREALERNQSLEQTALRGHTILHYSRIYTGGAPEWRILPAIDHPEEPSRCMVSGTGLSHIRSAANRQAMHAAGEQITDSMRMYQWGVEGGKPAPGEIGAAPEWFYKGAGAVLRGHNEPLEVPAHADDGGEEPEIAGIYLIGSDGNPHRIGMTAGNEFSDHVLEKKNYLYLAASKLRPCAIGPELVTNPNFDLVEGEVSIERGGSLLWSKPIRTGQSVMCHSLANIEHHHFKFDAHRRPGDIHIHFFGADAFSFGEGIRLADGDVMQVRWQGFGQPLRNPIRLPREAAHLIKVKEIS